MNKLDEMDFWDTLLEDSLKEQELAKEILLEVLEYSFETGQIDSEDYNLPY